MRAFHFERTAIWCEEKAATQTTKRSTLMSSPISWFWMKVPFLAKLVLFFFFYSNHHEFISFGLRYIWSFHSNSLIRLNFNLVDARPSNPNRTTANCNQGETGTRILVCALVKMPIRMVELKRERGREREDGEHWILNEWRKSRGNIQWRL